MVINIRGTSGSGKSTIVRNLMAQYAKCDPVMEGHKIVGYTCFRENNGIPLYVVGRYTTPCGGCDTLNGMDYIYDFIHKAIDAKYDVIYEGLIVASDSKRAIALKDRAPLIIIELTTPLEMCVAGIQARRDARGDERPLSDKNTRAKMGQIASQRKHWKAANVDFRMLNREEALATVLKELGW